MGRGPSLGQLLLPKPPMQVPHRLQLSRRGSLRRPPLAAVQTVQRGDRLVGAAEKNKKIKAASGNVNGLERALNARLCAVARLGGLPCDESDPSQTVLHRGNNGEAAHGGAPGVSGWMRRGNTEAAG